MRYEKIRGKNVNECISKLRLDYGPEAIILEQRKVYEGGLLGSGLFSRKSYEIDYMIPEKTLKSNPSFSSKARVAQNMEPIRLVHPTKTNSAKLDTASISHQKSSGKSHYTSIKTSSKKPPLIEKIELAKDDGNYNVQKEYPLKQTPPPVSLSESEKMALRELYTFHQSKQQSAVPAIDKNSSLISHGLGRSYSDPLGSKSNVRLNAHFRRIQEKLLAAEMSSDFVDDFLKELENHLSKHEKEKYSNVEQRSLEQLAEIIRTAPTCPPVKGECRAVLFMGPTGSGKTTSLAKLAAHFHISEKRDVAIYSLDHYRLAATEQLKTYANVMGLSFHAPLYKDDFAEALRRDGAELILIDTSGVSYTDEERLSELRDYVQVCTNEISLELDLVVPANMNPGLLEKIMLAYEEVGFDKLVLTKIDETEFIGAFVEIADKFKRPFSFLMNGQQVPSDMNEADAGEIASMVLGL